MFFFFFYPFIDGQCYIVWEIICSKCEWLLQVRMLVWNWTLQYMAMLFSIKKTFAQSKPIHFSMLIRALKWDKGNQGAFRIDKNVWLIAINRELTLTFNVINRDELFLSFDSTNIAASAPTLSESTNLPQDHLL